jgi:hydrogenase nickel incorporation protein HypA/HybF
VHELAIAEAIVAIASAHADGARVERVEVKVGHLRQVVPDALTFAFQLVTDGTALAGAELVLEEVPAAGRCRACAAETDFLELPMTCAACGSFDLELLRGEELLVDALVLTREGVSSCGD